MTFRIRATYLSFTALLVVACASTTAPLTEFPAGIRTPSATEIASLVKGKSFNLASGGMRSDYGAAGNDITVYFSGRSDKDTWRAEDGRICYEFTTIPSACNDVRLLGNDLYLKRSNGQVTQLLPR